MYICTFIQSVCVIILNVLYTALRLLFFSNYTGNFCFCRDHFYDYYRLSSSFLLRLTSPVQCKGSAKRSFICRLICLSQAVMHCLNVLIFLLNIYKTREQQNLQWSDTSANRMFL